MTEPATDRPTPKQVKAWRKHLAEELGEAKIYRDLAQSRQGQEQAILEALADAEGRHAEYWRTRLGEQAKPQPRPPLHTTLLGFLARHFGFVFALALAGRSEARAATAGQEKDVPTAIRADEAIHAEVVRGLAESGRARLSGTFRAAVFGANDGLVSNLALVLGIGASGVETKVVLLTGLAGLLAGALSMAAGEYVSVASQRELLAASNPDPVADRALNHLDIDANELALVFRARGLDEQTAQAQADEVLAAAGAIGLPGVEANHEVVGSGVRAALSSFCFFASGAVIPVIPYAVGLSGLTAVALAAGLVGLGLVATGLGVAVLSGTPPVRKALRQLAIGYGAAAVTYVLGLAMGAAVG